MAEILTSHELQPYLPQLGITRVADLTGLDTIGLPVWSAIRPMARGLCVSAGKGLTAEAAWMSAVMEAAEQAMAERTKGLVAMVGSTDGLARKGVRTVPLHRQPRAHARHIDPDQELAWCSGIELTSGETVFAPYELVGLDLTADAPWDRKNFHMCSTGLGAGSTWETAVGHALLELIEEDATFAAIRGSIRQGVGPAEVAIEAPPSSGLFPLLGLLKEHGIDLRLRQLLSPNGLSVFAAALFPEPGAAMQQRFDGIACRKTAEEAVLAAILEACQSRLSYIAGARDDLLPGEYAARPTFKEQYGLLQITPREELSADPLSLGKLLRILQDDGISGVYAFDITAQGLPFKVVRVLADDLLSIVTPPGALSGPRAARNLLRQWATS